MLYNFQITTTLSGVLSAGTKTLPMEFLDPFLKISIGEFRFRRNKILIIEINEILQ